MNEEFCICTTLRQAAQQATDIYDRTMAPSGLKVTMYRLLAIIAQEDAPTITQLARRMGLDRSTLGRNVRVLERQGLLAETPGTDERTRVLDITAPGQAALEAARPLWNQAQTEMRAALGKTDTDSLLQILMEIRDHPTA